MELTAEIKMLLQDVAEKPKASDRRTFITKVVNTLGRGDNAAPNANWVGIAPLSAKALWNYSFHLNCLQ